MNAVVDEKRIDYTYTNKSGAVIHIHNVPAKTRVDMYGKTHRTFSIAVAMRLEELRKQAFAVDDAPSAVHHLEF
jgi:hypothetical protein